MLKGSDLKMLYYADKVDEQSSVDSMADSAANQSLISVQCILL